MAIVGINMRDGSELQESDLFKLPIREYNHAL
jgi:hypothetical protein